MVEAGGGLLLFEDHPTEAHTNKTCHGVDFAELSTNVLPQCVWEVFPLLVLIKTGVAMKRK